jgi:cell division protein FtsX
MSLARVTAAGIRDSDLHRWGAWLGTVAVGMVLRVAAGQGTAAAFVAVALAFVGLFLLGWRLVARMAGEVLRRRQGPVRLRGRSLR